MVTIGLFSGVEFLEESHNKAILQLSLSKAKTKAGHEGEPVTGGTILLGGEKIATFQEDDWGGPLRFDFVSEEASALFKATFPIKEWTKIFDDNDVFRMDLNKGQEADSLLSGFIYVLLDALEIKKTLKKIKRASKNKVVFGTLNATYEYRWKNVKSLNDMLSARNGREVIQNALDAAAKEIQNKENSNAQFIFHTKEQMDSLGVTYDSALLFPNFNSI